MFFAHSRVSNPSANDVTCPDHVDEVVRPLDEMRSQVIVECPEECSKWKGPMLIVITGIICLVPIITLIVSAFAAVPGDEIQGDGLASEESQTMRAFTMGWLFCLALKLRREFVGLAGSSSLMEPW